MSERYSRELTLEERESIIQFAIGNQELAGIELPRAKVEEIFERVIREPLLDLGGDEPMPHTESHPVQ